jgi:phage tail sheath gpL-like
MSISNRTFRSALAGLLVSALGAPAAFAATTGSVALSGTVTTTLAITVTPTGSASTLDLSGGVKIVKVADVAMLTNNEQGLTVSISSASLTKTGGSSIPWQVTTVADAGTAPLSAAFTVASGAAYTVGSSVAGTLDKDLYIKYTPLALQDPGTYTGTINLTVADN